MILEKVKQDLTIALKAQDKIALRSLRSLLAALEYKKSQLQKELTTEDEIAAVKSEIKKRQESIEIFEKYQKMDRARDEKDELEIINRYLPAQASDEDIKEVILEVKKVLGVDANKGQLIGAVISKMGKGAVDGTRVASLINQDEK